MLAGLYAGYLASVLQDFGSSDHISTGDDEDPYSLDYKVCSVFQQYKICP